MHGYSSGTNLCPGQILVWFPSILFFHFKIKMTIPKKKQWPLLFMLQSECEVRHIKPPGNSWEFPEKSTHWKTQRKVFDRPLEVPNTKKSDKKATCPSQEIRKKSGQIWFFCKRIYFLCPFDPEKTKHMTYTSPINHLYNLWLDIYIYILFQTLAS